MSEQFEMKKQQIEDRAIPQSLNKGETYYRNGRVGECVRRGNTLEASVQGSEHSPYHVEIECSENGEIQTTWCTCPYDWGGDCKHIIAVLLMFINNPDRFQEKKTSTQALENRSRDELQTLIELMLEREPSLRSLLDRELPGSGGNPKELQDPDVYRHEVPDVFDVHSNFDRHRGLETQLNTLLEQAEQHLNANEFGHAYGICRALIEEVLDQYEMVRDDGGLIRTVNRAVKHIGKCLEAFEAEPEQRREIIEFLFSVLEWDIDFGGIHMGDGAWERIMEHAKEEDRKILVDRIKHSISEEEEISSWTEDRYGHLLLDLYGEEDGDDAFLETAEELGLHRVLAYRLIDLDRTDEAVEVAAEHITHPYRTIRFADRLLEAGETQEAKMLVERCADRNDDDRLRVWLSEFEEEHGDPETAFQVEWSRFQEKGSLQKYHRLCNLAEMLGKRKETEEALKEELEEKEQWKVLAKIYLEEEEWDRSWEYAKRYQGYAGGRSVSIREKVVQESERARPERAVEFYRNRAMTLIDRRGRGNYADAAEYLQRVQQILKRENNESEWTSCITQFREYASNLPACQDEMDKAGLENPLDADKT